MLAADLVQPGQDGGGRQRLAIDRNRIATLKGNFHELGRIGRLFHRNHALIDEFGRLLGRVFQNLALGRGVQQVCVNREGRLAALVLGDRNLVRLGKFQKLGARGQIPQPPGRDDLDGRVKCRDTQLEPDLIVALAGRAMGHGIGAGFLRDADQMFGNQRPGDRGAQEIKPLIKRIGPEHREHEIAHEFFAQIDDVDVLRRNAHQLGLLARRLQLFALAQIGGEGHHLAAIFGLQPFQDDRGVQTARIGKHDFLGLQHGKAPSRVSPAISWKRMKGQATGRFRASCKHRSRKHRLTCGGNPQSCLQSKQRRQP